MKILSIHNHYQQPGGEDTAVELETAMLRDAGHQVIEYRRSNSEVAELTLGQKALLPLRTIWSAAARAEVRNLVLRHRPDVAHFHNTHFMISPSAYYACRELGVPVVQTIHNYRLLCPSANFLRDGRVCEDCLDKHVPWPGVLHACYRDSRVQTGIVAGMLTFHRFRRTWQRQVDRYIVLTEFVRDKLIQGGVPHHLIRVKPNAVFPDPGPGEWRTGDDAYLIFVGRLAPEKGIETLLNGWQLFTRNGTPPIGLKIVGDGPLAPMVVEAARRLPRIEWLGPQPKATVMQLLKGGLALVVPSIWYEVLPYVILEAFAVGLPVIASDLGNLSTIVRSGSTGLHHIAGDAHSLAEQILWLWAHPTERYRMGQAARAEFEVRYAPEANRRMLLGIYQDLVTACGSPQERSVSKAARG
jgi:glycosyltransferase involved in cell wall biosynthesis